jgi:23S rRNA (uracil1939-C5)-methyltransferase
MFGFAPGAMPGDELSVTEIEEHGHFVRARHFEIVSPGPDRVDAPCPFAHACGGCDWMTLSRPAQLAAKRGLVEEALRRTGGFRDAIVTPIVTSGPDTRYRSRVRFQVREGRLGFFGKTSHRLVEIDDCLVASPPIGGVLRRLRQATPEALEGVSGVEVRVATDESVVVRFLVDSSHSPGGSQARVLTQLLRDTGASACFTAQEEERAPIQRFSLGARVHLLATPTVFTQVNWHVNQAIVGSIVDGVSQRGLKSFADLYAGAGNFTLPLLSANLEGVAVEVSSSSIACASEAAAAAGLTRGSFLCGEARDFASKFAREGRRFDVVLLDPPRAGARDVLPAVVSLVPDYVAYVSCDPVTFARDARTLASSGFAMGSVVPYDMFPHTHHVEVVAWFARSAAPEGAVKD